MVRTRIAPSPTGGLHIGTARTALFNCLFTKKTGGEFLIRIEDTDKERSTKEHEQNILDGLKWLGIEWNGTIVRQSERDDIYLRYISELKEKGLVYEEKAREGDGVALILKKPEKDISFTDTIRGEVVFANSELKDLVIQKPDGSPTYNFAVTVDDHEMNITHIIRGEDHIPNTPKQIMVYEALGWDVPIFSHLPLILAPDRSKLSKRHGATTVSEFSEKGYLPEAMINYMALLGWHPSDEKEIFSLEELVQVFEINNVQKGGAVFDNTKLEWVNEQHIKKLSADEYKRRLEDFVGRPVSDTFAQMTHHRVKTLSEAKDEMKWLAAPQYDGALLSWKETSLDETKTNLTTALETIESMVEDDFSATQNIEKILMPVAEEKGRGAFLWPLRVALSGAEKSPSPFELVALLGKEETLNRIRSAIHKLS